MFPIKIPRITFWRSVFLIVLACGLYSTYLRFSAGLGASTALSDRFPWGLWIGFDVLCGSLWPLVVSRSAPWSMFLISNDSSRLSAQRS